MDDSVISSVEDVVCQCVDVDVVVQTRLPICGLQRLDLIPKIGQVSNKL
jgi:hypothetical protein